MTTIYKETTAVGNKTILINKINNDIKMVTITLLLLDRITTVWTKAKIISGYLSAVAATKIVITNTFFKNIFYRTMSLDDTMFSSK